METRIRELLARLAEGEIEASEAFEALRDLPFEDLGFAKVDHHRPLRTSAPETIFCAGKSLAEIGEIAKSLSKTGTSFMATRADRAAFDLVLGLVPEARYHPRARIITVGQGTLPKRGDVLILTGGTSDIPVAEEAAVAADMLGAKVERIYDVGVAGVHRLLSFRSRLEAANVIIAIAGMEGALPSVVGGLVSCPIIAVPTSIGYGASFGGLAALLTMMNSCAPGIAVVNIDNGFGAGTIASRINALKGED